MEINDNKFLFENDLDIEEQEDLETLSLLSEMIFTAPYEKYVIKMINRIIKNNYKTIEPLFEKNNYSNKEITEQFKKAIKNQKSNDIKKIDNKNQRKRNKSETKKAKNKITLNNSVCSQGNNDLYKISIDSLVSHINIDKIFDDSYNEPNEEKILSKSFQINNSHNKIKEEINYILDTFNFNGKEFEIHSQITLLQIFKCYEEKENSFKFLHNKIYKDLSTEIKQIEFDFLITNVDSKLFKFVLNHISNNILLLNINEKEYESNQKKQFKEILSVFDNNKNKYDILGEIGLNALDYEGKIDQFHKYSNLVNLLKNNNDKAFNEKKKEFYESTGIKEKNEKILFFITNSNSTNAYKYLKESKLYKTIKSSKNNLNYILCFLSTGINEIILSSNSIVDNNEDKKYLLNKTKLLNKGFMTSERFKKYCYKLNSLIYNIDDIKKNLYDEKNKNIKSLLISFESIFNLMKIELKKDLKTYFNYIELDKNIFYKNKLEQENKNIIF